MVVRDRLSQEAVKRFSTESKASTSTCIDNLLILGCKRKASSYKLHAILYPINLCFLWYSVCTVGEVKHLSFDLGFFFFSGRTTTSGSDGLRIWHWRYIVIFSLTNTLGIIFKKYNTDNKVSSNFLNWVYALIFLFYTLIHLKVEYLPYINVILLTNIPYWDLF